MPDNSTTAPFTAQTLRSRPHGGAGRIVVGVDGERASDAAVRWAAHRAVTTGESVVVATATSRNIPGPGLLEALQSAHDDLIRALGDERVEQRMITEAPSIPEALIEEAGTDPLVIGHHRSRALRSALTGWLPLDIALQADGPVFVIPDDVVVGVGRPILVGVSPDGSARGAIEFAMQESRRTRLPVRLLLAEGTPSVGGALEIEAIADDLRHEFPHTIVTSTIVENPPGAALAEHAAAASLIVIGRHQATPLEEVLVGATGHHLMKATRVPICIVPLPEDYVLEPMVRPKQ